MESVNIKLPKDLIEKLDIFAKENNFNSRKECIIAILEEKID